MSFVSSQAAPEPISASLNAPRSRLSASVLRGPRGTQVSGRPHSQPLEDVFLFWAAWPLISVRLFLSLREESALLLSLGFRGFLFS